MFYKLLFFGLLLAAALFAGCNCCKRATQKSVPYTPTSGYFVKNTFRPGLHELKIDSQADFDAVFGVGRTMANRPTVIDFSVQFAIAAVAEETAFSTIISPDSFVETDDTLRLTYKIEQGDKQSYTVRPFLLLAVSRKHEKEVRYKRL
ncbi:MAG: hypothetical protein LBR34_08515 [Prevotella sp.]|jgi:hypothetical protein|nr:hypothetical protein [Prevotella sp.]